MKQQFNSFAKQLEEIPKLKPDAHFAINDAATLVLNGQPMSDIENDSLNSIFSELQDLDRDIAYYLLNNNSEGVITMDECLIVSSCLLAAKQIGPENSKLRDVFYTSSMSVSEFEDLIKGVLIPESSRTVIVNVYKKILESNKKINKNKEIDQSSQD